MDESKAESCSSCHVVSVGIGAWSRIWILVDRHVACNGLLGWLLVGRHLAWLLVGHLTGLLVGHLAWLLVGTWSNLGWLVGHLAWLSLVNSRGRSVLRVGNVVLLALGVHILLLFPAVVENLEDAEGAGHENDDDEDNEDDQDHVNPVDTLRVRVVKVTLVIVVVRAAPVLLPVTCKGIDDEDDETDCTEDIHDQRDEVDELANAGIVGLSNDHAEQESHDEVPDKSCPLSHDCLTDRANQVEDTNDDGCLGQCHAATAALIVLCIYAHFQSFNYYNGSNHLV